jgi:hypothetical protein
MEIFKFKVMALIISLAYSAYASDCDSSCTPDKLSNSICDPECNFEKCRYDNGFCDDTHRNFCLQCEPLKNNGVCDTTCNTPECGYDGNDCEYECAKDCKLYMLVNGICDEPCYTQNCGWDSLDCTKECQMNCLEYFLEDGICDDECNSKECNFDGGDCDEADEDDYIVNVMTAVGFGLIAATLCGYNLGRVIIIVWRFLRKHRFFNRNSVRDDVQNLDSAETLPVIYN